MQIKQLTEKRAALVTNMRALLNTASEAGRSLNTEEQTSYDKMDLEVSAFGKTIQADNLLSKVEANLASERDGSYRPGVAAATNKAGRNRPVDTEDYKASLFGQYARHGQGNIAPEFRNALQVGTSSEGGYLVPTEFETALVKVLVNMDPIRAAAHVITTASDRNIPIESSKGTFDYVAEEGAYGVASDPAFGQVVLSSFKSGGIIKVADELLQDAFFNLEQYLMENAAERFNALETVNFATGNGSGRPKGMFATTAVGGVSIANTTLGAAALTFDNLVDIYHTLGRRYRANASWVMNDSTVKYLRKIKTGLSGDTSYVWQPSTVVGQPDTVLGRPVIVDDSAPAIGTGLVSIALIDLSKYYIADRLGTSMQRLNELYAGTGQVGFKFTRRNDGRLVDASAMVTGTHA